MINDDSQITFANIQQPSSNRLLLNRSKVNSGMYGTSSSSMIDNKIKRRSIDRKYLNKTMNNFSTNQNTTSPADIEKRIRILKKKEMQEKRLERFQQLITQFVGMYKLDKNNPKTEDSPNKAPPSQFQSGILSPNQETLSLKQMPLMSQKNDPTIMSEAGQSPPKNLEENQNKQADNKESIRTSQVLNESFHQQSTQHNISQYLLTREQGEMMTFSEKLHGQSKMQRQNLRVTISRLQKLQKAYYDTMLGVNDPIKDQYNTLFNLLQDAGGAISPWGKLSRRTSMVKRTKTGMFSSSSSKGGSGSIKDPKRLQAIKIGTLLNIQKTFSFKGSSSSTPMRFTSGVNTPTIIHLTEEEHNDLGRKVNMQIKEKSRNDKQIIMKQLGITEEQYNRRQSQLDQNEKINSISIQTGASSHPPTQHKSIKKQQQQNYPQFQKNADNFIEGFLQEQTLKQLVPSTVQPSTLFQSNNVEFNELEIFVKKLTDRINNQHVVEKAIIDKREEYLNKLSHPITMSAAQQKEQSQHESKKYLYRGGGSNHFSKVSMFSKSRYSNASSSSQIGSHPRSYHQIPMPNFKEYVQKLKVIEQAKKGSIGQVFAGTSFVGQIQEANTTGLLRNVLAQALEKVLDMSQVNATEWLSQFKIEYVNLQIMREEFAKKELLEILRRQDGDQTIGKDQQDTINTSEFKRRILLSHSTLSNDGNNNAKLQEQMSELSSIQISQKGEGEIKDKSDMDTSSNINIAATNKFPDDKEVVNYDMLCNIVKPLSFFRSLKMTIIKKLLQKGHYFIAAKDTQIDTSSGNSLYIILSGSVAIRKKRKDGIFTFTMNSLYDGYTFSRQNVDVVDTLSEQELHINHKNLNDNTAVKQLDENNKGNQIFKQRSTCFYALENCDLLCVNRKLFSKLMFSQMKEQLRKKIHILRQTKFFEEIDPYALLILACNVEVKKFKYGHILCKQNRLPDTFYILHKGSCRVVIQAIMVRNKEVSQYARKCLQKYVNKDMHFGLTDFLPPERLKIDKRSIYKTNIATGGDGNGEDEDDTSAYPATLMYRLLEDQDDQDEYEMDDNSSDDLQRNYQQQRSNIFNESNISGLDNNSEFSLQISRQNSPSHSYKFNRKGSMKKKNIRRKVKSPQSLFTPKTIKSTFTGKVEQDSFEQNYEHKVKGILSPMTHACLLERGAKSYQTEVIQQFGGKEFEQKKKFGYRQQIKIDQLNEGAEFGSRALVDKESIKSYLYYHAADYGIDAKTLLKTEKFNQSITSKKSKLPRKKSPIRLINRKGTLARCDQYQLEMLFQNMMKAQVSIIADSSQIQVVSINKKSLDYLNDQIKNYIKKVVFEKNFKDQDRPYDFDGEVKELLKQEKNWDNYKLNLTEGFLKQLSRKKKFVGKDQ